MYSVCAVCYSLTTQNFRLFFGGFFVKKTFVDLISQTQLNKHTCIVVMFVYLFICV